MAYARRLNLASQQGQGGARVNDQPLSLAQLASLSGASEANLRQDPQLFPLPEELAPVRLAFPRQDNENAMAYARRLNLGSQQGQAGARVNDQPLSLSQLASLSGAPKSNLRQDPQLFPLPEELAPVRLAFPRQDDEKPKAYARRLNLASQQGQAGARVNDQPLSLTQLASLSGVIESDLRRDPQLFPLPEELATVRLAFPRQAKESAIAYARRLNLASQQGEAGTRVNDQPLSLSQLASLSGAREAELRRDPKLFPLPEELEPVRLAFPRQVKESALGYARRLNLASQQGQLGARVNDQPLSLSQLARLSGAAESNLRQDPQLLPLPEELALVRLAFPRQAKESAIAYARRLNLASQQGEAGARVNDQPLSLSQLASLSGTMEAVLRQDPQLFPLPEELAPVRRAFPRQDDEKPMAYARRLNLASQQGQAGTRVNDQPLSVAQLASLSGATESTLRQDPQLFPLPEELAPVRQAFPRQAKESANAYARRLNLASQQGQVGARVNDQPLSLSQLASLSGAIESNLRQDPQLFPLPNELAPVRLAFPRQDDEKPIAYARRLNLASQQGQVAARVNDQPLSLSQLARLSGAKEAELRRDPQLFPLPEELAPVRQAFPRQAKESAIAYARRLNLASQQGRAGARVNDQPLTLTQLASLSGATESHLRQDPKLSPLPSELAPVRLAFSK
jgi:hypothetical protein